MKLWLAGWPNKPQDSSAPARQSAKFSKFSFPDFPHFTLLYTSRFPTPLPWQSYQSVNVHGQAALDLHFAFGQHENKLKHERKRWSKRGSV